MVQGEVQVVLGVATPHQDGPDQRPAGQVEPVPSLLHPHDRRRVRPVRFRRSHGRRQVRPGGLCQIRVRLHGQAWSVGALLERRLAVVGDDDQAQGLVPGHQVVEGGPQRGHVERADQPSAQATLYAGLPGSSWSRNHRRAWACEGRAGPSGRGGMGARRRWAGGGRGRRRSGW